MYVLCLFVVLAALFITVLNSRTAKNIGIGDNHFTEFSSSASSKNINSSPEINEVNSVPPSSKRNSEKLHPVPTFF